MLKHLIRNALSLALSFVVLAAGGASAAQLPEYPFLHVTGSAFVAVVPDIATLDFEIVAVDADPAAGRALLETRIGEVRTLMGELSLDPEDVVVREVRQSLRKGDAGAEAPRYELRCDVHIKVANLSVWPRLAGGILGKPNLDGFAASFDRTDMDRINDELVVEAIRDARRRGEVMAGGFGRRLGSVMAATPDALKNLTTAMGLERAEFRNTRSAGPAPAQQSDREQLLTVPAIKLRQPVDVIFRIGAANKSATNSGG